MSAGQQVLRRLESAYRAFFKGQRGERFNSVNFKPGDGAARKGRDLYLQNVGLVRARWHRDLPNKTKLKNIILLRKPSGGMSCCRSSFLTPSRSRKRARPWA